MGFFDILKTVGNSMAESMGSDYPGTICTEQYKCSCGLIRYFPESAPDGRTVNAQPGQECTRGDGTKHFFVKVHR